MKKFIKWFVPPIVDMAVSLIRGLRGRWLLSSYPSIEYNTKRGKKIFVMGNGPSAKVFLVNQLDALEGCDCMAVNHFADTEYFEKIKPTHYLLADPIFYVNPENLKDYQKKIAWDSINFIVEKLKWQMTIFMPINAKDALSVEKLKSNKFVGIRFYNSYGSSSLIHNKKFLYFLWNHNCIAHLSQTVLNACMGVAIQMGYSEINLVGADTSWHENYWMDQKTNDLYTVDKHFYGEEKVPIRDDNGVPTTIHQELNTVSIALESYWQLADFAKHNNVKIYNASAYSWIDAYERKQL